MKSARVAAFALSAEVALLSAVGMAPHATALALEERVGVGALVLPEEPILGAVSRSAPHRAIEGLPRSRVWLHPMAQSSRRGTVRFASAATLTRAGFALDLLPASAGAGGHGPGGLDVLSLDASFSEPQAKDLAKEDYWVHPTLTRNPPRVIAVAPMVNMTSDLEMSHVLQDEVYSRLQAKGYQKVSAEKVSAVMGRLGIQTAEMLSGISYSRLCKELGSDAILQGELNQAGTQHKGVYDAVVVSTSLRLTECGTAQELWRAEQFRAAHRQFQLDPFNFLLNLAAHEKASKPERVAWLVQEMLRTLPSGPLQVVSGDLLGQAVEIAVQPETQKSQGGRNGDELLGRLRFVPGGATLDAAAKSALESWLEMVRPDSVDEILLVGWALAGEPVVDVKGLAVDRARASRDWLLEHLGSGSKAFRIEGRVADEGRGLDDQRKAVSVGPRVDVYLRRRTEK